MKKKFLYIGLPILLIAIQFIPVNRAIPENIDASQDFIAMLTPPTEIATQIKNSCYECHSHTTEYPWYAEVAPISWWIQGHVNGGKQKMNFAEWGTYSAKKKDHKLEECIESVETKWMPLNSYTWLHPEAKMNTEQRANLVAYFKGLSDDD